MALDTLITGANLDAAGNVKVSLTNTAANIGGVRLFSENDAVSNYLKSPETSSDYRLRVGVDTLLFTDTFNANIQNTSLWSYALVTLTAIQATNAGFLTFGAVQGTASGHGATMRTFQYFPLLGTAPLSTEFTFGQFGAALVAGEQYAMGLGVPAGVATLPTDGVFCTLSTAGLVGSLVYNGGSPVQTGILAPLSAFVVGTTYKLSIVVGETEIEYWLDDVLLGEQSIPAALGQPFIAASQPIFMMKYCNGAVSNTNTIRVCDVTVSLMDLATNKPWAHQLAGMNQNGLFLQNGHAPASTALLSTQAIGTVTSGSSPQVPNTVGAGSNSTPAVLGLGGWGMTNMVAAAVTDFIMMAYTNPAPSNIISGKNLYICGIRVNAINTGAIVGTTPTVNLITLGVGATLATLATVETGSFVTATTHAARRCQLGFMSVPVGAVIGAAYNNDINMAWTVPLMVRPGEIVEVFFKTLVGTATASQSWTYNVVFDSYWE